MRLLADENFPKPIIDALRAEGHDVLWARTDLAGASDVALLDLAESDSRIVLTLDKDFFLIAVQRRNPLQQSGVVLFRVHPATPEPRTARACIWRGRHHVGRTHQHRHGRRNSDGGCAASVRRSFIGEPDQPEIPNGRVPPRCSVRSIVPSLPEYWWPPSPPTFRLASSSTFSIRLCAPRPPQPQASPSAPGPVRRARHSSVGHFALELFIGAHADSD